jgi:hypothetical protein
LVAERVVRRYRQSADPFGSPSSPSASIEVGLRLNGHTDFIEQSFPLRGPGDVIGIDPVQVIRTDPFMV